MAKKKFNLDDYSISPAAAPQTPEEDVPLEDIPFIPDDEPSAQSVRTPEQKPSPVKRKRPKIQPTPTETCTKVVNLRLRPSTFEAARMLAQERGLSLSRLITLLLEKEILKNG